MPRGVYQRTAGFGAANRQRAARRRELQEAQAQEIERLRARVARQRAGLLRATQVISDQRAVINGIVGVRGFIADAKPWPWAGSAHDATAQILLASMFVGAQAQRVALVSGRPLAEVHDAEDRLRRSGVWVGDRVVHTWREGPDRLVVLACDVAVAEGELYRDPAAPDRYARTPFAAVVASAPAKPRPRTKGDVAEIDTCADCRRRPAYRGVCAHHLLIVRTRDMALRLGIDANTVAKWRLIVNGRCRTCGQGPLKAAGFCAAHYERHQALGKVSKQRRRREWTISRDEMDQWGAPAVDAVEPEEQDARTLLFNRLLHDLLGSLPEWPATRGRPRQPIRDLIFSLVTVARTGLSTRAVAPVLIQARAVGWLSSIPHYNSLCRYLDEDAHRLEPAAEAVLGAINAALAELGVEPGYPVAPAAPLVPTAAASPIWLRMRGVAAQRRTKAAIDLAARPAVGSCGLDQRLGQIVRALTVLAHVVMRRGIEPWLTIDQASSRA